GRQVDPTDPNSILPVERPTGVPSFYMIHVVVPLNGDGTTPAEIPGTYRIDFSSQIGNTIHVPPTQANFTVSSANPGDQSAIIPTDTNDDGISDITLAVTLTIRYCPNAAPFWNEGVYVIFGKSTGFTGVIDVVRDADVTIRGFTPAGTLTSDNRLSIAGADVN